MDTLFQKFDQLSYRTALFLSLSLTLLLLLPLFLLVVQKQTSFTSKAALPVPTVTPLQQKSEGILPSTAPSIRRVWPWIGKPGDTIIIEGIHFGTNPPNSRISLGDVIVPDDHIVSWDDTRIELLLPPSIVNGTRLNLRIHTFPIVESAPLSFYSETTALKLHKQGNAIMMDQIPTPLTLTIQTSEAGSPSAQYISLSPNTNPTTIATLAPSATITSLLLKDANGQYIPYAVDPTEFGF